MSSHDLEPAGLGPCSLCANQAIAMCGRCHHLICSDHRRVRLQFRWQHRATSGDWYGYRSTWRSYAPTGGEWVLCPRCDTAIAREERCALAIDRREWRWRTGCASATLALYLVGMLAAVVYASLTGFPR